MIERGSHHNIPEIERICPLCKSSIENEIHFQPNGDYKSHQTDFENKTVAICKHFFNWKK